MMSLKTQRLCLRPFLETDLQNLIDLDTDPEVMRFIGVGKVSSLEETNELLVKILKRQAGFTTYGTWMANLISGENIGWFTLKPNLGLNGDFELGYRLKQKFWGQGFATEGSMFLVQYGFEVLKVKKIVAVTDPENKGSQHVLKKCGLIDKGLIPSPFAVEHPKCTFYERLT